jgi:1-acyl-sn-glycerol-3-phosphate acyltransferase
MILFAVAVSTLPLTLLAAAAADMAKRTPWSFTRCVLFFTWYLACEVVGIVVSTGAWLLLQIPAPRRRERYLRWHFKLECLWARWLLRGAATIFGMRFEVEGDDDIGTAPLLLFMRHASVGDTVIPTAFLSDRWGLRLRHVMKRELLWDPCLDLVGNRVPNYFVDRRGAESTREIAGVAALAEDMRPGDGVVLFPEGTRFTQPKREKILEKLARDGHPGIEARARSLVHVLPPKLGGALALLESRPDADVMFCAHVGFDRATSFSTFLRGGLVRTTIKVIFWRITAAEVPADREARIAWFFDQWTRVDRWIGVQRGEVPSPGVGLVDEPKREERFSEAPL